MTEYAKSLQEKIRREEGMREEAINLYKECKSFDVVTKQLGIQDIFKVVRWVKEHNMTTKRRYY